VDVTGDWDMTTNTITVADLSLSSSAPTGGFQPLASGLVTTITSVTIFIKIGASEPKTTAGAYKTQWTNGYGTPVRLTMQVGGASHGEGPVELELSVF
jgi:hypothetical protein